MKKERNYRRISWTFRLKIEALYNAGHSFRFIAHQTGFAPSSIYNEVQHGLYPHMGAETTKRPLRYSAQIAQDYADLQKTVKGPAVKLGRHYEYASYISEQIILGRSPDAIVGALRRAGKWTVSTTTLYRYIECGYIPNVSNKDLPEKPKQKQTKSHVRPASRPPKGKSIERRPHHINTRSTFGHWELDSVIGKAAGKYESLLTFIERRTRFQVIIRVPNKEAGTTTKAIAHVLSKFPRGTVKTITVDNGSEFQDYEGLKALVEEVYYCHPYCSSERGSNERANRIIRRFFPKGKSMKRVTQKDCDRAAHWMNTMPRKILNYATAEELFQQELANLQTKA